MNSNNKKFLKIIFTLKNSYVKCECTNSGNVEKE